MLVHITLASSQGCASAQSQQSFRCWHTQSTAVVDAQLKIETYTLLNSCAWKFKERMYTYATSTCISFSKKLAIFQHLTKVGCCLLSERTVAIWKGNFSSSFKRKSYAVSYAKVLWWPILQTIWIQIRQLFRSNKVFASVIKLVSGAFEKMQQTHNADNILWQWTKISAG